MKSVTRKLALGISAAAGIFACCLPINARELVIYHTNDTHSQIEPNDEGLGGVMRRKALLDSVRAADPNMILIDAGDAVQGTLYYTLYKGEVEQKIMNALGYDYAILGNHDFDDGMENLEKNLRANEATWITTNYDITGTNINDLMLPYDIREVDGRKIGFIGINLKPEGMISASKCKGVKFADPYEAANDMAWLLKNRLGADMVVAITHLGYTDPKLASDTSLIAHSRDIDLVIGGHSHTMINPADPECEAVAPSKILNADGRAITVAQIKNSGPAVGRIVIDLDNMEVVSSGIIPVDSRFDNYTDSTIEEILRPYKSQVDSLLSINVAKSTGPLDKISIVNIFSDLVRERGKELIGKTPDMALINNGGIRNELPKGDISLGQLIMTIPFNNIVEVVEIKGDKLIEVMSQINHKDITGVSSNVRSVYDPATLICIDATIDGKHIDPEKTYTVATLDYLAEGGDYLSAMKSGNVIATSPNWLREDIKTALIKSKKKLQPQPTPRVAPLLVKAN